MGLNWQGGVRGWGGAGRVGLRVVGVELVRWSLGWGGVELAGWGEGGAGRVELRVGWG